MQQGPFGSAELFTGAISSRTIMEPGGELRDNGLAEQPA